MRPIMVILKGLIILLFGQAGLENVAIVAILAITFWLFISVAINVNSQG